MNREYMHDAICRDVSSRLRASGFGVEEEVSLGNGRGAVDILARKNGERPYIVEVKSRPASRSQGKICKQFSRYSEKFGELAKYLLVSPAHNGELRVVDFVTGQVVTL